MMKLSEIPYFKEQNEKNQSLIFQSLFNWNAGRDGLKKTKKSFLSRQSGDDF